MRFMTYPQCSRIVAFVESKDSCTCGMERKVWNEDVEKWYLKARILVSQWPIHITSIRGRLASKDDAYSSLHKQELSPPNNVW